MAARNPQTVAESYIDVVGSSRDAATHLGQIKDVKANKNQVGRAGSDISTLPPYEESMEVFGRAFAAVDGMGDDSSSTADDAPATPNKLAQLSSMVNREPSVSPGRPSDAPAEADLSIPVEDETNGAVTAPAVLPSAPQFLQSSSKDRDLEPRAAMQVKSPLASLSEESLSPESFCDKIDGIISTGQSSAKPSISTSTPAKPSPVTKKIKGKKIVPSSRSILPPSLTISSSPEGPFEGIPSSSRQYLITDQMIKLIDQTKLPLPSHLEQVVMVWINDEFNYIHLDSCVIPISTLIKMISIVKSNSTRRLKLARCWPNLAMFNLLRRVSHAGSKAVKINQAELDRLNPVDMSQIDDRMKMMTDVIVTSISEVVKAYKDLNNMWTGKLNNFFTTMDALLQNISSQQKTITDREAFLMNVYLKLKDMEGW